MDSIRVERLRCLSNTGDIQLKPITVLLGENSSGKSSFLRIFPLLKQSVEARTTGPILWNGRLVDFGTYETAHQNNSSEGIAFSFQFKIKKEDNRSSYPSFLDVINISDDINLSLKLELSEDTATKTTLTQGLSLTLNDSKIKINFGEDGYLSKFFINSLDVLKFGQKYKFIKSDNKNLLPIIMEDDSKDENKQEGVSELTKIILYGSNRYIPFSNILENLRIQIKNLSTHNISDNRVARMIVSLGIASSETMLKNIKSNSAADKTFLKKTAKWTTKTQDFQEFRDLVIAKNLPFIIEGCDKILGNISRSTRYIGPVRATAERYYRTQDLAVDEVDYQGRNLAMFLRNLATDKLKSFNKWTNKYFGFELSIEQTLELVSLKIKPTLDKPNQSHNKAINIADTGFGFSQILPVITQLWLLSEESDFLSNERISRNQPRPVIFAIEQPELHLHPRLQGVLTDVFVAAIQAAKDKGIDLRLIIETHSKILVNRLGHLIYKNTISAEDVNIVLFEAGEDSGKVTVKTSHFDDEGYLIDWPLGFFEMDD
jgi:predicted ATPase